MNGSGEVAIKYALVHEDVCHDDDIDDDNGNEFSTNGHDLIADMAAKPNVTVLIHENGSSRRYDDDDDDDDGIDMYGGIPPTCSELCTRISGLIILLVFIILNIPVAFFLRLSPTVAWMFGISVVLTVCSILATYLVDPGVVPPSPPGDPGIDPPRKVDELPENNKTETMDSDKSNNSMDTCITIDENDGTSNNNEENDRIISSTGIDVNIRSSSSSSSRRYPPIPSEFPTSWIINTKDIDGVKHKWCSPCRIWRPPGTSHCHFCGYCMKLYDHHCGVIGSCIAGRNRRFFISLLTFGSVASLILLVSAIMFAVELKHEDGHWHNWHWYLTIIICLAHGYVSIFITPFAIIQLFLGITGLTEKQVLGRERARPTIQHFLSCPKHFYELCLSPLGSGFKRYRNNQGYHKGYMKWM